MNGPLALLIALVSYGNNYLKNENSVYTLDLNNSTLIYCKTIEFNLNVDTSLKQTVVAHTPQEWFSFLKKDGCKSLKIYYAHSANDSPMKDFESNAFVGGGGQWIIEAVYTDYCNYWTAKESVIKNDAGKDRIWDIRFSLVQREKPILDLAIGPEKAKENLLASLKKITAFADSTKSENWAKVFKKAGENLYSSNPVIEYNKDFIIVDSASLQSKQLLFAADMASVFGGMGSWNDILYPTPELEKTNTLLSSDLYDRINEAIIVAVNNKEGRIN